MPKRITQTFKFSKEKLHSQVFAPIGLEPGVPAITAGIYIYKSLIPAGATECKITVTWPEGGKDKDYNDLK